MWKVPVGEAELLTSQHTLKAEIPTYLLPGREKEEEVGI